MVATRKSLTTSTPAGTPPNSSSDPAVPASDGGDDTLPANPKLRNALKKLAIDGTAALSGARVKRDATLPVQTYHCRGAVYEVIPGTREEWIEKQPKRYLQGRGRSSSGVTASVSAGDEKDSEMGEEGAGEQKLAEKVGGKKRKRGSEGEVDEVEQARAVKKWKGVLQEQTTASVKAEKKRESGVQQETLQQARAGKKRAREVHEAEDEIPVTKTTNANTNNNVTTTANEHTHPDTPPSKRPRRNADNYNVSYVRPRNISDFTPTRRSNNNNDRTTKPAPAPKGRGRGRRSTTTNNNQPVDRMRLSREHDYAVVGGHEELSCIEHARRRAALMGYQVEPLPRHAIARSRALEQTTLRDIVRLARLNGQIERVTAEMKKGEEMLRKAGVGDEGVGRGQRGSEGVANGVVWETGIAANGASVLPSAVQMLAAVQGPTPSSQAAASRSQSPPASVSPPTNVPGNTTSSAPPSTTTSSSVEIITSRHDSAASLPPPTTTNPIPSNPTTLPNSTDTRPPAAHTTLSRGGHTIRWSLPKQVLEEGRAENELFEKIKSSKLAGESRTARRRRVRRELKLVSQWAIVPEDGNDDGAGAREGEKEGVKEGEAGDVEMEVGGMAPDEMQLEREQEDAIAGAAEVEVEAEEEEDEDADVNAMRTPVNNNATGMKPNEKDKPMKSKLHLTTTPQTSTTTTTTKLPPPMSTRSSTRRSTDTTTSNNNNSAPSSTTSTPASAASSESSEHRRSSRVEKSKTRVCADWIARGECRRGKRCTYLHVDPAAPSSRRAEL